MKKLTMQTYLDKVRACWLGKNVGGTLGTPFESARGTVDVDYYTHDLSIGVLPNDDLDLQLAWLIAAEHEGRRLDAAVLVEYWLSYVVPDWSEYGIGKRNLRNGILPSASGGFENDFRFSNGAWIRSEIWACLAPGRPDVAVRYAYEDSVIDHMGEGVWAEMFCAAIESAAFVEEDMEKLIDIGLSYIPHDCALSQAIAYVRTLAADKSLDWRAARKCLLRKFPSSFGTHPVPGQEPETDVPMGERGFDAPANIAIALLGHYFGGGDFSRAICIATGCCEDSDCTAGTLAALYGIRGGTACIEERWLRPIGDEIKTVSLDRTKEGICATVSELTERVARLMPTFVYDAVRYDGEGRLSLELPDGDALFAPNEEFCRNFHADRFVLRRESGLLTVKALFDELHLAEGQPIKIDLLAALKIPSHQHTNYLKLIWHMPPEWEAPEGRECCMALHGYWDHEPRHLSIIPHDLTRSRYRVTLEICEESTPGRIYIPFTFVNMI